VHPLRAGQSVATVNETLNPAKYRLPDSLEGAATGNHALIEVRDISAGRAMQSCSGPMNPTRFSPAGPVRRNAEAANPRSLATGGSRLINEAIIEARHKPETARSLSR